MKNKSFILTIIVFVILLVVCTVLTTLYITRVKPEDIVAKNVVDYQDTEYTERDVTSTAEINAVSEQRSVTSEDIVDESKEQEDLVISTTGSTVIPFDYDIVTSEVIDLSTITDSKIADAVQILADKFGYTAVFSLDKMQTLFAFPNEDALWYVSTIDTGWYVEPRGKYTENIEVLTKEASNNDAHTVDLSSIDTSLATEQSKALVAQFIYAASLNMEDPWQTYAYDPAYPGDYITGTFDPSEYIYITQPDGSVVLHFVSRWEQDGLSGLESFQPEVTFNADRTMAYLNYYKNFNYANWEDYVLGRSTEFISQQY